MIRNVPLLWVLVGLALLSSSFSFAFSPFASLIGVSSRTGRSETSCKSSSGSESGGEAPHGDLKRKINDLITEQACSTAVYYWMELRGNIYAEWLTRHVKSLGKGGLQSLAWDDFLMNMLSSPVEEVVIKKLVKQSRGGSGTNPYLAARKPVEYTEVLDPAVLGARVLEIREQVSADLARDLRRVSQENEEVLEFYMATAKLSNPEAVRKMASWQPAKELETASVMAPYRAQTYERTLKLATQLSVESMLSEFRVSDRHKLRWLSTFLEKETTKGGNELLAALMEGPMVLIHPSATASKPKVVEPLRLAAQLMKLRLELSKEFLDHLSRVPQDHEAIKARIQLEMMWDKPGADKSAG
ncbi:unnamed protein product [Chrysoparadoxa australica]